MNLDNIYEGQVVKNYKEMCWLLCEPEKAGNSKKSQLKHWKNYLDYSKKGHKFIINKIYEIPLEILNIETNHHKKYSNYVRKILVDRLSYEFLENDSKKMYISINDLSLYLNMVNQRYVDYKHKQDELSEELDISEEIISDFYDVTNRTVRRAIQTSIRGLESDGVILSDNINVLLMRNIKEPNKTLIAEINDDIAPLVIESKLLAKREVGYSELGAIINDKYVNFMKCLCRNLTPMIHEKLPYLKSYNVIWVYKVYRIRFTDYILEEKKIIDQYLLKNRIDDFNALNKIMYEESLTKFSSSNNEDIPFLQDKSEKQILADYTILNEVDKDHILNAKKLVLHNLSEINKEIMLLEKVMKI